MTKKLQKYIILRKIMYNLTMSKKKFYEKPFMLLVGSTNSMIFLN